MFVRIGAYKYANASIDSILLNDISKVIKVLKSMDFIYFRIGGC